MAALNLSWGQFLGQKFGSNSFLLHKLLKLLKYILRWSSEIKYSELWRRWAIFNKVCWIACISGSYRSEKECAQHCFICYLDETVCWYWRSAPNKTKLKLKIKNMKSALNKTYTSRPIKNSKKNYIWIHVGPQKMVNFFINRALCSHLQSGISLGYWGKISWQQ